MLGRPFFAVLSAALIVLVSSPPAAAAEAVSLENAIRAGKVQGQITGMGSSSGDAIQIGIRRRVREAIRITISPGTVFRSATGRCQNMVAVGVKGERIGPKSYRPSEEIVLADDRVHNYLVESYCLDFHKDNPSPADGFALAPPDETAAWILKAGKASSASIQAIQSALWIARENISPQQIASRFPVTQQDLQAAYVLIQQAQQEAIKHRQQSSSGRR